MNISDWLEHQFKEHKLMRRIVLFWIMSLLTGATYKVFWSNKTGLSAEYIALTGLLGLCFTFYQWMREKDGD